MNIEDLAKELKPWIQVDTWHTGHPSDDERFHKALSNAFNKFGNSISYGNFEDAIRHSVNEHYPNKFDEQFLNEAIEKFAENAETISSYLSDL